MKTRANLLESDNTLAVSSYKTKESILGTSQVNNLVETIISPHADLRHPKFRPETA